MAICRPRKDVSLPIKRGHSPELRPRKAVPRMMMITKTQAPFSFLLQYPKTADIFKVHPIANCQHLCDENGWRAGGEYRGVCRRGKSHILWTTSGT